MEPAACGDVMVVQGILVAATLLGLTTTSSSGVIAAANAIAPADVALPTGAELWLNLVTMVTELGLPVLLMGVAFPLANAIIQDVEREVGQRAGLLYLSNTIGAVAGSLAAGFVFLPVLGIQQSATVVALASALAIVPLYLTTRVVAHERAGSLGQIGALAASALVALIALLSWLSLPPNYLIANAQTPPVEGEKIVALDEGVNEVISIADVPDAGRQLLTNGPPDVIDQSDESALHARACSYPSAVARSTRGQNTRHRLWRR
jgi:spermidine synthase